MQTIEHDKSLEQLIVDHPFWVDLNPQYFHLLNDCASLVHVGVNQPIFQEGQDATHFYLIQSGEIALETFVPGRGMITIQTIGAGGALGWSWMSPPFLWHFSARSIDATELISFGAAHLRENAEANHDFGYELLKRVNRVMYQRLQATRLQLLDFYGIRT